MPTDQTPARRSPRAAVTSRTAYRFDAKSALELPPGKHRLSDSTPGLILEVTPTGSRSWVLRYWHGGRERYAGLGALKEVTPAKAREAAEAMRDELRRGVDPIASRRERRQQQEAAKGKTVAEVAAAYREAHSSGWRPNYLKAVSSMHAVIVADLGDRPIASLDVEAVVGFLRPRWTTIPDRARKMQALLAQMIDFAAAHGWVDPDRRNPASLAVVKHLLPRREKAEPRHLKALDWRDVPLFWKALSERTGGAAEALRVIVMTGCRTTEILGARWSEVDLDEGTLSIPASRMKAGVAHVAVLVPSAVEALRRQAELRRGEYIFPTHTARKPLSGMAILSLLGRMGVREQTTVHGFRSALRSWCQDQAVPHDLAEALLAHRQDRVVSAYARSAMIGRRREVLLRWEAHVTGQAQAEAEVVPLRRTRSA